MISACMARHTYNGLSEVKHSSSAPSYENFDVLRKERVSKLPTEHPEDKWPFSTKSYLCRLNSLLQSLSSYKEKWPGSKRVSFLPTHTYTLVKEEILETQLDVTVPIQLLVN